MIWHWWFVLVALVVGVPAGLVIDRRWSWLRWVPELREFSSHLPPVVPEAEQDGGDPADDPGDEVTGHALAVEPVAELAEGHRR